MENLTTKELLKMYNEIVEEWEKSNTLFSLTDLTKIVKELTVRGKI